MDVEEPKSCRKGDLTVKPKGNAFKDKGTRITTKFNIVQNIIVNSVRQKDIKNFTYDRVNYLPRI